VISAYKFGSSGYFRTLDASDPDRDEYTYQTEKDGDSKLNATSIIAVFDITKESSNSYYVSYDCFGPRFSLGFEINLSVNENNQCENVSVKVISY
jgi:hypothetical protein